MKRMSISSCYGHDNSLLKPQSLMFIYIFPRVFQIYVFRFSFMLLFMAVFEPVAQILWLMLTVIWVGRMLYEG